jgi:inorganic triphosphatase YgiF
VQTLKTRGDGHLQRLEHEVLVQAEGDTPQLEPARHGGTPAGLTLFKVLGDDVCKLAPMFETDVMRTHRMLHHAGVSVEVALDIGEIRAGSASTELFEIEFELKRGPVSGLIAMADRWAQRHALWLDTRSKAERGDQLARGFTCGPHVLAGNPALKPGMDADSALREIVKSCLAQILPNASEIAAGVGRPEHLHQARVGLRRLRSALRVFADWSTEVDPNWQVALASLFTSLGSARDRDALAASLLPELRLAGAPLWDLPADLASEDAGEALCACDCVRLLLALTNFAHGFALPPMLSPGATTAHAEGKLRDLVRPHLGKLHRQVTRDAVHFLNAEDEMRHRTRKRLKRLRYCVEFTASLYRSASVQRYLARLRPAQDALGEYNDLTVAAAAFRKQLAHDPRAWFALGWLAARREQLLETAARALTALAATPGFWSK